MPSTKEKGKERMGIKEIETGTTIAKGKTKEKDGKAVVKERAKEELLGTNMVKEKMETGEKAKAKRRERTKENEKEEKEKVKTKEMGRTL